MPFLAEMIKIEKVEKVVANLYDKTEYVIHIRNLKQALNHRLVLKKVHRNVKFYEKAWLKPLYWYEHRSKKKKQKVILKTILLSWWIM